MPTYIGIKQVTAEPRDGVNGEPGYLVIYEGGHESWSPKAVFERFYLRMGDDPSTITEPMVTGFVRHCNSTKVGAKTSLLIAKMLTGFEIVESSSCVDAKNYNQVIGDQANLVKVQDKIWAYLGFVLQWARQGLS